MIADEVIGEIRLPRVDRRRREDLAHRDERGVLRHQHGRRRAQPRGLDHERPVELGRLRLQSVDRLGIVELGDVAALLRRPLVFGHRGFERDDRVGLGARVTNARECLDALDVRAVRLAIALVFLARKQIVVARHAEPALADDGGVLRRVGQAGDDAEVHRRRIVRRGEQHLERGLVFRRGDPVEIRLERRRAARLDPLHVHPARVEVADLPARGAVLSGVLPHFVEDAANVDLGFVDRRSRPTPAEGRSGAISVRASQAPLAYVQKSSPGFTPCFCDVRSSPKRPNFAVPGADWVNTGTAHASRPTVTATPTRAVVFMSMLPQQRCPILNGMSE